ncbi:MAG TPA: PAS domain-containing protein, partial [Tenuifilaceae bacterium]|nr:PAS domain-containing protein [Tenuifilaceae bacterium]
MMNTELNTILLSAYEHMEHMVLITNSKGIIVYANNAICNLYGYTKDELIGAPSDLFDAKLYPPQYLESIKTTLSKGETWKG